MRTLAIVAVVWFVVSVLFAIGWARFFVRIMDDAETGEL